MVSICLGACAMTTNFLNNKMCTFNILLSWRFPRKTAFWTIFLSAPQGRPPPTLKKRNNYFYCRLAVSDCRCLAWESSIYSTVFCCRWEWAGNNHGREYCRSHCVRPTFAASTSVHKQHAYLWHGRHPRPIRVALGFYEALSLERGGGNLG